MYSTYKAEGTKGDYDMTQKDSYRKGKENDWSFSTRNIPDFCAHFDYGKNSCNSDVTSQDTCIANKDIKDKQLNCEFSECCSNIDSGGDRSCWQTENIASSHIFTNMEEECLHSAFKHGNSDCIRCKGIGHRGRDMMDTNSDERIPMDQGGCSRVSRSSMSQSSVQGSENIGPKRSSKVDTTPVGECNGEIKENLQHSNTVESKHLDENEGRQTLKDDKPSDVNKQDLLKHLFKGSKRTQRGRKRPVKKSGNLHRENIRNVQGVVGEAYGAWPWALSVFGLLEQGLHILREAFPVWIATGYTVLCYLLVLGVLSVFPVVCWLGTCVRWICVSVVSKARAMTSDFNAFSRQRQRRRAYEPSEHQHRPVHSGFARDTYSTQQTLNEENMDADEIISHLLSSKHLDAYSVLRVSKQASDDEIKRKYREMAKIVHPDKNSNKKSGEAFQVLQSAFELISDQEKRMVYQFESNKKKFEEDFETFVDLMTNHVNELKCKIICSNCNKTHPRLPSDRLVNAARYCARCDARHAAKEGDVWVETSHMGFKYYCYLCMDNQVYEVTEWGACQGLLINNRANAHGVYLSVKSNRPSCSPWDDLFGESDQPSQPYQNKKKRHKNRAKGGNKNKKR